MAKKHISKCTGNELYKALQDIENEISALEDTKRKIENEITQRNNPHINFDFVDFYIDVNL